MDVSNVDQVKKLKSDIENDIGPVDVLVNNAGLIPLLSLREGSEIEIERIVKVNITSQFFVNILKLYFPHCGESSLIRTVYCI